MQILIITFSSLAQHTTFQLVLSTNGVKSFALFLYHRMGPSSNTCGHIPYGKEEIQLLMVLGLARPNACST